MKKEEIENKVKEGMKGFPYSENFVKRQTESLLKEITSRNQGYLDKIELLQKCIEEEPIALIEDRIKEMKEMISNQGKL